MGGDVCGGVDAPTIRSRSRPKAYSQTKKDP